MNEACILSSCPQRIDIYRAWTAKTAVSRFVPEFSTHLWLQSTHFNVQAAKVLYFSFHTFLSYFPFIVVN